MAIEIRRNKQGELIRSTWWCRISVKGVRTSYSLNIPIKGKLPPSWIPEVREWPMSDRGDVWFEESRAKAEEAYAKLKANPPQPKMIDLGEAFNKGFKAQKKHKYRTVKITDILKNYDAIFASIGTPVADTPYANWQRGIVERFVKWWRDSKKSMKTPFYDVTPEEGQAFITYLAKEEDDGRRITTTTLERMKAHMIRTFKAFCPYVRSNPFEMKLKASTDEEVIHREPLAEDEMNLVLQTAQNTDPLMYELIVTGLCTALRKGDICTLKWSSITDAEWELNGEIKKGSIRLRTHKTGEPVNIPIFPLFGIVLTKRQSEHKTSPFVFPEAEQLYHSDPSALTRRIKQVFARALGEKKGAFIEDAPTAEEISPKDALPLVMKALESAKIQRNTRANILKIMPLYAGGMTYRKIKEVTACNMATISGTLKQAEKISGTKFIASSKRPPSKLQMEKAIDKVTRTQRKVGMKAASTYDFHCLRTTFVTLAAKNKIPLETVRLITGHTDTRMLEEYYNRAQGVDLASTFAKAMPAILMQDIPTPMLCNGTCDEPTLPAPPLDRSNALKAVEGFLTSNKLTKNEKKQLIQAMLFADD